ncbi:MAG: hypothetical protein M1820_005231 [Bogoriella megaspora]|nr:MAG: hypothetical protein M1820_005231 [Bogoriella megaspora]
MSSSSEDTAGGGWAEDGKIDVHFRYGPMIEVHVGKKSHEEAAQNADRHSETFGIFHIYENLARHFSGFFRKALEKEWKEARTRIIELPEDDPYTFALFAGWMLKGDNRIWSTSIYFKINTGEMMALYILADKLDVPNLKDAAINLLCEEDLVYNWWGNRRVILELYRNTVTGSSLRRLAVYLVHEKLDVVECCDAFKGDARELATELSEFFFEIHMERIRRRNDDRRMNICDFHEHDKDALCKAGQTELRGPETST